MPLVEVTLAEGRTPAQIRTLMHELHAAVVRAVDAAPSSVRVIVREVPPTHSYHRRRHPRRTPRPRPRPGP